MGKRSKNATRRKTNRENAEFDFIEMGEEPTKGRNEPKTIFANASKKSKNKNKNKGFQKQASLNKALGLSDVAMEEISTKTSK
jgi:hypothetical protein